MLCEMHGTNGPTASLSDTVAPVSVLPTLPVSFPSSKGDLGMQVWVSDMDGGFLHLSVRS